MSRLTAREYAALIAYARTGDARQAAHQMRQAYQHTKNLLSSAYQKLGVTGAISAYRELGWLVFPFGMRATGEVALGINVQAVALT